MQFDVLTLFPEMFDILDESIIGRAKEKGLINVNLINIRDFSNNKHEKVDIFVSNPPYIPNDQDIEAMVKDNEPHVALFGGNDGLYFYRKIFKEVKPLLNDRALLAFEMGFDQRELMETAIKEFFGDYPFEIIKDINGKDRMLFIYYNLK